jgi:hypothetical protein
MDALEEAELAYREAVENDILYTSLRSEACCMRVLGLVRRTSRVHTLSQDETIVASDFHEHLLASRAPSPTQRTVITGFAD